MQRSPNIVICSCDQLRAFETGCYGNPVIRTPNIDRLSAEGVRFETAVTNFPVCMAARSVLLSGQYNRTCTGGVSNVAYQLTTGEYTLPEYPEFGRPHLKNTTFPEILQQHGYTTAVIGKWHIHSWPHEVGFDYYLIPRVHHCHTGQSFTENGQSEFVPAGYSVDFEAQRVESFLQHKSHSDTPFFLYYNISPPHCPIADCPEAFRTMYDSDQIPIRPNVDLQTPLNNQEYHFKVYRNDFRYYSLHLPYTELLPSDYSLRHVMAEYYGMTTWMDSAFGRLLLALDQHGLAENTIVVFTSDHGDNLGSHGLVQKGGPTEESVRIPLIFRLPGRQASSRVVTNDVGSLVDIAPTLLSLAYIDPPDHFHGKNLLLEESCIPQNPYAIIENTCGVAVRTPQFTCNLGYTPRTLDLENQPSLFTDLTNDPYQLQNLAESKDLFEAEKMECVALLRDWDERTPWMQ